MKVTLTTLLAFTSLATSTPIIKRATTPTEVQILNFALTLEHLENNFYTTFFKQFSPQDFTAAGFEPFVHGRMAQIAEHEAEHVRFLQSALGDKATQPCEYSFPVKNVKDFVALSQIFEGVGTTAYLGAAHFLHTPSYVTAAGSILTMEARHNAWLNSVTQHSYPWSGAMDTPQTLNQVFSLATSFIKSCPSTNPTLPVKAFPALTATPTVFPATSTGSETISLSFNSSSPSVGNQYLVLLHGLEFTPVPIKNGKATLPSGLQGTVYAVVSKDKTADDASTLAGPIILTFPFSSFESN